MNESQMNEMLERDRRQFEYQRRQHEIQRQAEQEAMMRAGTPSQFGRNAMNDDVRNIVSEFFDTAALSAKPSKKLLLLCE